MFKLICLLGLFLAIDAAAVDTLPKDKNIDVSFVTTKQLNRLLEENPGLIEIQRSVGKQAKTASGVQPRVLVDYTLGYRVSGDRIVAYNTDSYYWSTPQDVALRIDYPTSGTGAIVSAVAIHCSQSNGMGRAYVVAGGIGQRRISIVVEAVATYYFNYEVYIYGY